MSRKNGGERYVKSFDGYVHLLTMLFAVIMRFDSLLPRYFKFIPGGVSECGGNFVPLREICRFCLIFVGQGLLLNFNYIWIRSRKTLQKTE